MKDVSHLVDERERLRAVARLGPMSRPAGAFADSVVTAAAAIAGTPVGAVTIVRADVVQVRTSCGMDIGGAPRGDSICTHAVAGQEPFIVPDARLDPRLMTNPFVVGPPYVRFYAGFPLIVDAQSVGVLCVTDDRPRTLTHEQRRRLAVLARGAAAWLLLEAQDTANGQVVP